MPQRKYSFRPEPDADAPVRPRAARDHDGFVAPGGPEAADPGAQASDADPMELVAFLLQLGPGVAAHADANDLASGSPGSASHEHGEYAFASYETQRSHQKMILGPS